MRSLLFGLWATSLIASSIALLECDLDVDEQALYSLCDRSLVAKCVSSSVDTDTFALLEQCLIAGGCLAEDAAATVMTQCIYPAVPAREHVYGDLRKRQKNKDSSTSNSQATPTDQTSSAVQTTTDSPSTTDSSSESSSAAQTSSSAAPSTTDSSSSTDSPSTTSASPASTTSSSASSTTSSPSSTSSMTKSSSSTTTTSSPSIKASTTPTTTTLVCLATSQVSTTWCVTSTSAGSIISTCIPTFTPSVSCAAGLLCQTQAAGETTCMVIQNNLTTSGLVVTIIFSTIVFAFLATLCGMCVKSSRASRRRALAREAALVAGMQTKNNNNNMQQDVEASSRSYGPRGRMASAGASEDHLPLIASSGPNNGSRGGSRGGSHSRDASADRRPVAHRVPSGTYQEVVAARAPSGAPRLHPGLMDMGTEEDDMGYRGARGGR